MQLASENQSLKMDITDLMTRSMRDNMVFSNTHAMPEETPNVIENTARFPEEIAEDGES
jgi:hypothetical protein